MHCVINIAKDYIFYVYVHKSELGLAFDAVKKVSEFLNNNSLKIFEGAKTGQAKLEAMNKRFVEVSNPLSKVYELFRIISVHKIVSNPSGPIII